VLTSAPLNREKIIAWEERTIIDKPIQWWKSSRTEILSRMLADKCEYCGKETKCEVHHIRKLSQLLKRKDLVGWKKMMAMRSRKTLVLCPECHDKLHAGKLD
jgi:AI2M/AI1M-like HNH endonuclease